MEPEHLGQLQKEVENDICKEVKNYQNEIANAKFKIWPELVSSFNKGLASGSIAAVALNMIGGAGYTLVYATHTGSDATFANNFEKQS